MKKTIIAKEENNDNLDDNQQEEYCQQSDQTFISEIVDDISQLPIEIFAESSFSLSKPVATTCSISSTTSDSTCSNLTANINNLYQNAKCNSDRPLVLLIIADYNMQ